MKKFFVYVSLAMLLMSYLLIPAGTPIEVVREWLAYEFSALLVLYFLFHTFERQDNL